MWLSMTQYLILFSISFHLRCLCHYVSLMPLSRPSMTQDWCLGLIEASVSAMQIPATWHSWHPKEPWLSWLKECQRTGKHFREKQASQRRKVQSSSQGHKAATASPSLAQAILDGHLHPPETPTDALALHTASQYFTVLPMTVFESSKIQ